MSLGDPCISVDTSSQKVVTLGIGCTSETITARCLSKKTESAKYRTARKWHGTDGEERLDERTSYDLTDLGKAVISDCDGLVTSGQPG